MIGNALRSQKGKSQARKAVVSGPGSPVDRLGRQSPIATDSPRAARKRRDVVHLLHLQDSLLVTSVCRRNCRSILSIRRWRRTHCRHDRRSERGGVTPITGWFNFGSATLIRRGQRSAACQASRRSRAVGGHNILKVQPLSSRRLGSSRPEG